jgi:hypothetical protein
MVDLGSLAAERASTLTGDVVRAPLRARTSWMLLDWATQPHYTLVQTFLFAPYFANAIVENSACGTLISSAASVAATKPASTIRMVEKPMPGSPSHRMLSPVINARERAAIQGLRAPRPSAAAPS